MSHLKVYKESLGYEEGSPLTLYIYFIQLYRMLDTILPNYLLTLENTVAVLHYSYLTNRGVVAVIHKLAIYRVTHLTHFGYEVDLVTACL